MKHTPGPWQEVVDVDGDVWVCPEGERETHAHTYYVGNMENTCGECHANARLIAAAPELLAALIDVDNSLGGGPPTRLTDRVKAAIAKVQGE